MQPHPVSLKRGTRRVDNEMQSYLSRSAKSSEKTGKNQSHRNFFRAGCPSLTPHAFKMEMRDLGVLVFDLREMSPPPWQLEYFMDQLPTRLGRSQPLAPGPV